MSQEHDGPRDPERDAEDEPPTAVDEVDEVGEESFPASDPPESYNVD